jgi:hypothetical protein
MSTYMPTDLRNNPIPVLRMREDKAHTINVTATSARNSTAFDAETRVVSLYATEDMFIRFGNSSITATTSHHFLPAGTYYDVSLGGQGNGFASHVAAIRSTSDGTLYISEKE